MNTRPKHRGARHTFPQVGLQEALTAAFGVYSANPGTHTVDESSFEALVGQDLSASAMTRLVASLKGYDLIDRRRNGYALTDRAVQLFTTEDYLEFKARLDDVAVFLPLMRELSENYGDQTDSKKLDVDLRDRQIGGRDKATVVRVLRENERLLRHDLSCRELFETFRAFRLRAVRPSLGAGIAAARSWLKSQQGRTGMLSTVAVLFAGTLIYFATTRPGSQAASGGQAAQDRTPRKIRPPVPEVSLPITVGPVNTENIGPAAAFGPVPTGWGVTSSAAAGSAITRLTATGQARPSGPMAANTRRAPVTAPAAPVAVVTVQATPALPAPKPTASAAMARAPTASVPATQAVPAAPTPTAPAPASAVSAGTRRTEVETPRPTAAGPATPNPPVTSSSVLGRPASRPSEARPTPAVATVARPTPVPQASPVPAAPSPGAQAPKTETARTRTPVLQGPTLHTPRSDAPVADSSTGPATSAATVQSGSGPPYFSAALTRGRELAELFYSQRLTPLWRAFSPALQAEWEGFSAFQAYRMGGLRAFGTEKTLLAEDVRQDQGVSYYTRTATFELGPQKPWTLIIGLNAQGEVVEFNVVAASVLPQADANPDR